MRLLGEILTLLIVVSALGIAALAAGFGVDAWWCRCGALERRSLTEGGHADASE